MAGSGYRNWAAGETPAADIFDTYLQEQSVMVFATIAARDAALAVVKSEGMVCYVTATDRFYAYTGATWVVIGWSSPGGRVGVELVRGAVQTLTTGVLTTAIFDTEYFDPDGFFPGPGNSTLTVPAGMGGMYSITAHALGSANWTGNTGAEFKLNAGGYQWDAMARAGSGLHATQTVVVPLTAGANVTLQVRQANGGNVNFNFWVWMYRLTP